MAQTRTKVADIAPLNRPIKSIEAEVYLFISGTNSIEDRATTFPTLYGRQIVRGTNIIFADLKAREFESHAVGVGQPPATIGTGFGGDE
jgi:hypothetical protein